MYCNPPVNIFLSDSHSIRVTYRKKLLSYLSISESALPPISRPVHKLFRSTCQADPDLPADMPPAGCASLMLNDSSDR
jgi:hypothetical protein